MALRRSARRPVLALAAAGALASTGTVFLGTRNLLAEQADLTRRTIPRSLSAPPRADGIYERGSPVVLPWRRGSDADVDADLRLMVFGDSMAAGYGCNRPDEVPGALIARALAEQTGGRVRLSTKAIIGATSRGLSGQVDAAFVAGPLPDIAVIVIGANDVTALNGIAGSARRLGAAVRRLRGCGAVVIVGTCPDFGVVDAIPQPLRWVAGTRGKQLARAQTAAIQAAGGIAVAFGDKLSPKFRARPEVMFCADHYHPSASGYALLTGKLIQPLTFAVQSGAMRRRDAAEPTNGVAVGVLTVQR